MGAARLAMAHVIVLLGAPGAGKGTQAVRLARARGLAHVSTGDLLRDHQKRGTELGRKAKSFMDAGQLVPDELVLDMLDERVSREDCRKGYVLDGFPRTEVQARALERRLTGNRVDVVNLDVSDETIVQRAEGRLSCKQCGAVYHGKNAPPKKPGVCDVCGGPLVQRPDDAAPVVRERLRVYREKTAPLLHYYGERGLLESIDGERDPDAVFTDLQGLVQGDG